MIFFTSCKPSICDCKSIGYEYSLRDLTRYKYADKWENCKDSYFDEISNWQKTYNGPCYSLDPAVCFFDNKCN
jgi:hypothetical protein